MTDVDPYVQPAAEPVPRPRLAGLRPWLGLVIVLLLLSGWWSTQVAMDREDPTLQVPGEVPSEPQVPALPEE
ncbi:MAG TPA: hypothetical protein VMM13_07795 [Euzebya sp.]|nr:hypothetical protein [Euzebya sp.]